jgi:hypothetical protein
MGLFGTDSAAAAPHAFCCSYTVYMSRFPVSYLAPHVLVGERERWEEICSCKQCNYSTN